MFSRSFGPTISLTAPCFFLAVSIAPRAFGQTETSESLIGLISSSEQPSLRKSHRQVGLYSAQVQSHENIWDVGAVRFHPKSLTFRSLRLQSTNLLGSLGDLDLGLRYGFGLGQISGTLEEDTIAVSTASRNSAIFFADLNLGAEVLLNKFQYLKAGLAVDFGGRFLRHSSTLNGTERERGESFTSGWLVLRAIWDRWFLGVELGRILNISSSSWSQDSSRLTSVGLGLEF